MGGVRVVVKYRDLLRDLWTLHLVRFEGRGLAMCFPDGGGNIAQWCSIIVTVAIVSFSLSLVKSCGPEKDRFVTGCFRASCYLSRFLFLFLDLAVGKELKREIAVRCRLDFWKLVSAYLLTPWVAR